MSTEVWAEVAPGYFVSNEGRVRGVTGRILNPSPNSQGYSTFSIGRRSVKLHSLVAKYHVSGWFEGAEVRHLDGNKSNNAAFNLAWGTHGQNVLDQVRHGTHVLANREYCPQGHPYDSENTRISNGRRHCRACDKESNLKWRTRNRDAILARRRERDRQRRTLANLTTETESTNGD